MTVACLELDGERQFNNRTDASLSSTNTGSAAKRENAVLAPTVLGGRGRRRDLDRLFMAEDLRTFSHRAATICPSAENPIFLQSFFSLFIALNDVSWLQTQRSALKRRVGDHSFFQSQARPLFLCLGILAFAPTFRNRSSPRSL